MSRSEEYSKGRITVLRPSPAPQLCRHRAQRSVEHHVQHERFDRIVSVMPERNLRATQALCEVVQNTSAQARAHAAVGLPFGNALGHQLIGVFANDPVPVTMFAQPGLERGAIVARLALIEVHSDELERHRRSLARALQEMQQGVAVLAAADGDHHAVAGLDELVIGNASPHLASESLFQSGLAHARWVPGRGRGCKAFGHFALRSETARACASKPSSRASPSRRSAWPVMAACEYRISDERTTKS